MTLRPDHQALLAEERECLSRLQRVLAYGPELKQASSSGDVDARLNASPSRR